MTTTFDTPELSDTMKRRLAQENEGYQEPSDNLDGAHYPNLTSVDEAGEEDDDEKMKQKLDMLPVPPPEYVKGGPEPWLNSEEEKKTLPEYTSNPSLREKTLRIESFDSDIFEQQPSG